MNRMSAEYQDKVRQFVSREVYYCVSHLISELSGNPEYCDEIGDQLMVRYDYLEPARDEVANLPREEVIEYLESISINCNESEPTEILREALCVALEDGDICPQMFCDEHNLDPYEREAFEHWLVSDWLANRLEERGEMILKNFMGLTIWGRTTTGQAILLDEVICDIWDSIQ